MQADNNTILLTGGTSGIGLALLKEFSALNNKIIVTSRKQARLDQLKGKYPDIYTVQCELASKDSVKNLIEVCKRDYPDLNMLINNAGIQYIFDWQDANLEAEKIDEEIQINLTSPLKIIHGLLPLLAEKKNAAIVNVSSGLAFAPKKTAPLYCASKAAIHNFSKALRYQLENSSVKVFEIIPPLVDTPMTEGRGRGKITVEQLADEFMKNFAKDKYESNIGKVKLLRLIQRISPALADRILKNS